jgi:hypothetical protein
MATSKADEYRAKAREAEQLCPNLHTRSQRRGVPTQLLAFCRPGEVGAYAKANQRQYTHDIAKAWGVGRSAGMLTDTPGERIGSDGEGSCTSR